MRVEREAKDFEGDRYLGDLMEGDDDMIYTEAMRFEAFWELAPAKQENGLVSSHSGEKDGSYVHESMLSTWLNGCWVPPYHPY